MNVFGFCFARGGSKGVIGKNLRMVGGRSLVARSVLLGLQVDQIGDFFISTDSSTIEEEAVQLGAKSIRRPENLCSDDSPEWESWRFAVEYVKNEITRGEEFVFVCLPATAPLRLIEDVEKCIKRFLKGDCDIVVTMSEAKRSPFFNMVKQTDADCVELVNEGAIPTRRQDCPQCFDLTTVCYVTSSEFIMERNRIFDGVVKGVLVPEERCIDIDTELDLAVADFLFQRRGG